MNDLQAKKQLLSCPGDTIQETIDSIGMSQAELAMRLGRSIPKLNELIKGKAPITQETATKLEYVLGIPAHFWLELEKIYRDELFKIQQMERLEQQQAWLKNFPVNQMKKLGLLPDIKEKPQLIESLLKFFRISTPQQWEQIYKEPSIAFKIALKHTSKPEAISVWLRMGEIQAENIQVNAFDKKKLREFIPQIKDICYQAPTDWLQQLQNIFAQSGVALVYTPIIDKAPVYGATRWIKNNSLPLIQITDRHKDYNAFWFTFFHELGHILYHGKKDIFIEGLSDIKQDKTKEQEADDFASRMLISDKARNEFDRYFTYTEKVVQQLSDEFRIHPSIIVSQLQRMKLIRYNDAKLNALKKKVVFEKHFLNLL